ncbi:uncharacterized protein LOC112560507 [Pomacea canaliculata]|uniref:uncharacterized protein LOC112560507 n=1 Tax=Pomacea canaliculata TaxID=400727 RepID=UPI000D737BCF|nr:uncharacterized protein LOC112560507 [Pomacea canaliculata]
MGNKTSQMLATGRSPCDAAVHERSLPHIEAPYTGPWAEYQFVDVKVPVDGDVKFSFTDVTMASTRTDSFLPTLAAVYSQGYRLVTFCRLQGSYQQKRPFVPGSSLRYQGILCRYEGDPGNEGWRLETEKSVLHVQHLTPGLVATDAGPGTQHVQQVISNIVHTGGRLLTVQWSGEAIPSATDSPLGVDMFFEVPDKPLPERSIYQLVTAPAHLVRRSILTSKGHLTCDWVGILTRHLARGWRLVDIFCEAPACSLPVALSPTHSKLQTVWFFEKPESRARDDSPVYEGTIVEHWVDASPPAAAGDCSAGLAGAVGRRGGGGCGGSGKKSSKKGQMSASIRKRGVEDCAGGRGGEGEEKRGTDGRRDPGEPVDSGPSSALQLDVPDTVTDKQSKGRNKNSNAASGGESTRSARARRSSGVAGWEAVVRSMGEKGWELACIVNTMDTHSLNKRTVVKVLLVFQRRLSLSLCLPVCRRTSDGLFLRPDTAASTTVICDLPTMTGDTSSHLNPSLAVRLPISRSGSRDGVDDFNTNDGDDDIPSTIGGSCSRTHSTTELSTHDPLLLEPGAAGRRRDGGGSYLEPIHVLGKEDEREAVGGRGTSWDARSSPQVTAEVHNSCEARVELQTDVTGEKLGCDSQCAWL